MWRKIKRKTFISLDRIAIESRYIKYDIYIVIFILAIQNLFRFRHDIKG